MSYSVKEIRKHIYLIEADTQYEITSMFVRPQEYYESPYQTIRGNFFTLEKYMDTYSKDHNNKFSYFTDWCGFNIPSSIFKKFLEVFQYSLSLKERTLLDLIKQINPNLEGNFYILGICKEKNIALKHEIAHAYFYLYENYKDEMLKLLVSKVPDCLIMDANAALRRRGYMDGFLDDEIQAYMATSNRTNMKMVLGWNKHFRLRISGALRKFYNAFDSTHK